MILVGHSYGGAVITEAGTNPKVAGLVYITAFAPDKGESVNTLIANPPPGAPVPPILPPKDGYLFLDKAKFPDSFAGDVDARPPRSWPTRKYRGVSMPLPARSRSQLGNPSPAGISKSAMTR